MWVHRSSRTSRLLPRKDSPKGSCHLVEPTWVTHLLRIAFRIVEVECILRAKQKRHLKVPELPSWVLNGLKCGSFGGKKQKVRRAGSWLSRMPCSEEKLQNWIWNSRYAELIRLCIPYNQVASLDVVPDCMPRPPAINWDQVMEKMAGQKNLSENWRDWVEKFESLVAKQVEVLHLFKCFTHTHTHFYKMQTHDIGWGIQKLQKWYP